MIQTTPEKIRSLRRKLYVKAKAEPDFRFYQLYDKVWREDILHHAYCLARSNKGAPGVDGVSFATIEAAGLENWLSGIRDELRTRLYVIFWSGAIRCRRVAPGVSPIRSFSGSSV